MNRNLTPELLSPAGNWDCVRAAVAGIDAGPWSMWRRRGMPGWKQHTVTLRIPGDTGRQWRRCGERVVHLRDRVGQMHR